MIEPKIVWWFECDCEWIGAVKVQCKIKCPNCGRELWGKKIEITKEIKQNSDGNFNLVEVWDV